MRALIGERHIEDEIALEPIDRLIDGELVDLCWIDARIDRACHQGHAARLRFVAVLRYERGGREDGDAGLANRDDVRPGPMTCRNLITWPVKSPRSKLPPVSGTSRMLCQSVM